MRANAKKNRKAEKIPLGSYRIIGGQWRGRRLMFPEAEGLRPTTDRVRETVFNWLAPCLSGAKVLDMFAGSGSLGFEALSRGAASLDATELDIRAVRMLQENRELLNAMAAIHQCNALDWPGKSGDSFDLVFIDPPFRQGLVAAAIAKVSDQALLSPGAYIYIEQEKEAPAPSVPANWRQLKEKEAGQVAYRLYRADVSE
ncbi:MAG: 16S rRNA (guanine(966)-N(2))-methyltransferase RsmD [Oleiphilus sp.]|nr:MAG: 16S rRNA (guanine(966)-N(2))-methyltransferase RsmD [Oleiphilus sp.]